MFLLFKVTILVLSRLSGLGNQRRLSANTDNISSSNLVLNGEGGGILAWYATLRDVAIAKTLTA